MPRLAVPLTDTAVRNAKPDTSKPKGHTLPDGGGLYLHAARWQKQHPAPGAFSQCATAGSIAGLANDEIDLP